MNHYIEEMRDWAETFTQTVREPFIVLTKELRVLAASNAFYRKFQITKEGSDGLIIYDLGNRQWDIPELRQLLEKMILEQNNIEDFEMRHHFEAVGEIVMLINARRVVHEEDKPGLILLAIEDITNLSVLSQEHKLRQDEKRQISEILEQLPAAICLLNHEGQILLGNTLSRSILPAMMPSIDPERINRWQTFDDKGQSIPPKQWPGARALRGETVIPGMEFVYIDDVGHEFWKLVTAVPFHGDNDSKEAIVIIQDITDIKRAEEALRESEEKFRALFEKGPIGVAFHKMVYDDKGKAIDYLFLDANSSYLEFTGVDPRGKCVTEAFPGIENDPFDWIGTFGRVAKTGEDIRFEQYLQLNKRWYDCVGYQVKADYFVTAFVDITERKRAEEKLKYLNDELEHIVERRSEELKKAQSQYLHAEKLSAIGQLSASIAHEFNNPLQGIRAILKGLKRRAILDEEDKELLDLAISENERIKNLIESLQDFNRPSAGQKKEMDVHAALDSLLLLYRSEFKRKKISIVLKYAEGFPPITVVPDQLKQVFLNLLNNATDACSEMGGMITISTCNSNQKVEIAIQDTGVGLSDDEKQKIFEPFFTTKPREKGTGLGLSICHDIMQYHQGEIRVESQPGKGSTFTILLPAI